MQTLFPSILPYNISLTAYVYGNSASLQNVLFSETPLSELSLELLLLQVVLPALLEQSHARTALKKLVRCWCRLVGRVLKLNDYLLPADEANEQQPQAGADDHQPRAAVPDAPPPPPPDVLGIGLAAQHQALLLAREPRTFQAYDRPAFFVARILLLLGCVSLTVVALSVLCCVLPGLSESFTR